ncbi:accessory gene regulator B [Anaerovirgula multivorans]|uniref:Accessory gene regulator B n=1 Tax=Anaerovirgula multivorans TaxID=312168 RepID=A0A239FJW7_9FIRM|nr:accessory gene regulator B family protein [Anaerovirgula multivorans]SNS57229.1 accessory gene regulator B [Anaerovirgula multivorans]
MIKDISKSIGNALGREIQADKDQVEIFIYALEIILGALVKSLALVLFSCIFGIFRTTIGCVLSFVIIRYFGGGVHLSTYNRCFAVGVMMFLVLGKVATKQLSTSILVTFLAISIILGIIIICKWVPAGTEKKKITEFKQKIQQKKKTALTLTVLSITSLYFIKIKLLNDSFSLLLGTLSSLFLITPWGYKVMYALDNKLNKLWKGGVFR